MLESWTHENDAGFARRSRARDEGLAQPTPQTAVATQAGVVQNRVKLPLIQCPPGTPKFNLTPEDIDRILLEQEVERFNEAGGH
ncbi:MAG: hypothetical protein EBS01_01305 [Verrucomicrobia bacterium]|nr:hypothetical protein [Verrucomicrobiota bacterium]